MMMDTHLTTRDQQSCTANPEAALRNRVCDHLKRLVLDCWFPACIDRQVGGFHQNFSRDWTRKPSTTRSLVFQSRMAWVAAEASHLFPSKRDHYLAIAQHGLDGIQQYLADGEQGGYYFATDPPGVPREAVDVKHAYAMAFVIYAAATASFAGASDRAKSMAIDAFTWLYNNAWDQKHGGCHEALQRSGKPVCVDASADQASGNDSIGTPLAHKTMNTHIHLLEACTALYRVWPDPLVKQVIENLQQLIYEKMWVEPGTVHTVFTNDWVPVKDGESFGHNVETAYLLVESMHALGKPDDADTWDKARMLVDHALKVGWDKAHGGFFDSGDGKGAVSDDTKTWWVQAEGLNALCLMHKHFYAQTDRYFEKLQQQWAFITQHQTDSVHGGWYGYLRWDGEQVLDGGEKANEWKTAYHNARALMNIIRLLEPGAK